MKDQRKKVPTKSWGLSVEADKLADTQVDKNQEPHAEIGTGPNVANDDDTREMPALSIEKLESMLKSKK